MTRFHLQPSLTATDRDGYPQIDDRPGQLFKGNGGILDHIDVYLGNDNGANTDGAYFVKVYQAAVDGDGLDPVPDEWAASTAYSQGDLVRPTGVSNPSSHFVYRCTVAGTSGGTEPTWYETSSDSGNSWSEIADEGDTVSDNTVTWEVVYVGYPSGFSLPGNTPTLGELAESDHYAYNPGANDGAAWRTCDFTGDDRIRLKYGMWYCVIVQWWSNTVDADNAPFVEGGDDASAEADHEGVCYLDGNSNVNNGPRVFEDFYFRLYESFTTLDKTSGTDAGFANKDSGGDTDPFNAGDQIGYTIQSGDALDDGVYWWKARVVDPSGSGTYSSFATARSFEVITGLVGYIIEGINMTDTPANVADLLAAAVDGMDLGEAIDPTMSLLAAAVDGMDLTDVDTRTATFPKSVADGITFSDAVAVIAALQALLSDGISLSDSTVALALLLAAANDGIDLSDVTTAVLPGGGANFDAFIVDGLSITDAPAGTMGYLVQAADGVDLADDPDRFGSYPVQAADGLTATDTNVATATFRVQVADGVTVSETTTSILAFLAAVVDGISLSDVADLPGDEAVGTVSVGFTSGVLTVSWSGSRATINWAAKDANITFEVG